jgi:ATP synthase I subunit
VKLDKPARALIKSAALKSIEKGDLQAAGVSQAAPGPKDQFTDPARVELRVWRNLFAVIAVATALAAYFAGLKFTLGLALGGCLAVFNFKWLHASLRAIMASGSDKRPPGTIFKIIFRWVAVGAVAYLAHRTGYFDMVAIITGLFSPALAVMIEAAYVTYRTVVEDHGER